MKGENERLLYEILNEAYPGKWEPDVKYLDNRNYRGDAVSKEFKVVVEIDGGIHPFWMTLPDGTKRMATKGGHSSVEGIKRDMEKSNESQIQGWKLLRFTPDMLRKTPFKIVSAVRRVCGYDPTGQQTLDLTGCKQATLGQVQVKLL